MSTGLSYEALARIGDWAPIRGCPGRLVLRGRSANLTIADLLGGDGARAQRYCSPHARDPVWVVRLSPGGTISYERPDGTWVHTLNTAEGFRRKLEQLGLTLDARAFSTVEEIEILG